MALSNEVKRFIARYIGSVQQLDVFLVVTGNSERTWTPDQIAAAVNLDPTAVKNRLLSLCVKGLVRAEDKGMNSFRFDLNVPEEEGVKALRAACEHNKPDVVDFIYNRREIGLRDFSDAFRLNQDDHDH